MNRVWCHRHCKRFPSFLTVLLHHRLWLMYRTQFCRRVSDSTVAFGPSCGSDVSVLLYIIRPYDQKIENYTNHLLQNVKGVTKVQTLLLRMYRCYIFNTAGSKIIRICLIINGVLWSQLIPSHACFFPRAFSYVNHCFTIQEIKGNSFCCLTNRRAKTYQDFGWTWRMIVWFSFASTPIQFHRIISYVPPKESGQTTLLTY